MTGRLCWCWNGGVSGLETEPPEESACHVCWWGRSGNTLRNSARERALRAPRRVVVRALPPRAPL